VGVKEIIPYLVQLSLMLIVAAVGMRARWRDVTSVSRHPRLLLRGMVAVNLVVPLVAVAMLAMLPIAPPVKAGVVIMAVSPLAPFTPGRMLKTGAEASYAVASTSR
jgi:BASS family bile acid:Na+ symporter